MSRFNYKNHPVISRVERISVSPTQDYPSIVDDPEFNRVQTVLKIRETIRDNYITRGFRDVAVRFVDGSVQDMIDSSKVDGRPLPDTLFFDVEVTMPKVVASEVAVGLKSLGYNYKQANKDSIPPTWREGNDHIYWS